MTELIDFRKIFYPKPLHFINISKIYFILFIYLFILFFAQKFKI